MQLFGTTYGFEKDVSEDCKSMEREYALVQMKRKSGECSSSGVSAKIIAHVEYEELFENKLVIMGAIIGKYDGLGADEDMVESVLNSTLSGKLKIVWIKQLDDSRN